MNIHFFHIDAFTDTLFKGNPAAVCLLSEWLNDDVLRKIAAEINLPVTAFIVGEKDTYTIRWLTPVDELDLCGHGTLAASWVIFHELESKISTIHFLSPKAGKLQATRKDTWVELNFPVKESTPIAPPPALIAGLDAPILQVLEYRNERLLVILANEATVKNMQPNIELLATLPQRGIIITSQGTTADFVSRTFYPYKTNWEDAVTGASHCLLVPYWAKVLNKTALHARQVSPRTGELLCQLQDERVLLAGQGVKFYESMISL